MNMHSGCWAWTQIDLWLASALLNLSAIFWCAINGLMEKRGSAIEAMGVKVNEFPHYLFCHGVRTWNINTIKDCKEIQSLQFTHWTKWDLSLERVPHFELNESMPHIATYCAKVWPLIGPRRVLPYSSPWWHTMFSSDNHWDSYDS